MRGRRRFEQRVLDQKHRQTDAREERLRLPARQREGRPNLLEHARDAFRRQREIERNVGRACLPHAEQRRRLRERAFDRDRNDRTSSHAAGSKRPCDRLGCLVDLGIAMGPSREGNGAGFRCSTRRRLDSRGEDLRIEVDRLARLEQNARLLLGQERELGQRSVGMRGGKLEHTSQVEEHPIHLRRVVEVAVVLDVAVKAQARHLRAGEGEVEARRAVVDVERRSLKARVLRRGRDGEVEIDVGDLDERIAAWVLLHAERLDQGGEGDLLMREGAVRGLAHLREQLREGHLGIDRAAQKQHVEEVADHALGLGPISIGDGGADDEVALA